MIAEQAAHIDELVRVAVGQTSARDAIIHQSWLRCVSEHKLDPVVLRDARIVPSGRLREHRDAMDEFLHTARFGVEMLYRQIAGLGYVLLLTDAKGITVDFIGDPTFNNTLRKAGLYLGADWNEPHAGTCAVGTCIAAEEALTVHQSDHFDATHIPLTCTAAPVFDPNGKLAAVLDISALRSMTGLITLDDGYANTGSCRSAITFIDGEQGILRYRGVPIEDLAKRSSFIETAELLIFGELPDAEQRDALRQQLAAVHGNEDVGALVKALRAQVRVDVAEERLAVIWDRYARYGTPEVTPTP